MISLDWRWAGILPQFAECRDPSPGHEGYPHWKVQAGHFIEKKKKEWGWSVPQIITFILNTKDQAAADGRSLMLCMGTEQEGPQLLPSPGEKGTQPKKFYLLLQVPALFC